MKHIVVCSCDGLDVAVHRSLSLLARLTLSLCLVAIFTLEIARACSRNYWLSVYRFGRPPNCGKSSKLRTTFVYYAEYFSETRDAKPRPALFPALQDRRNQFALEAAILNCQTGSSSKSAPTSRTTRTGRSTPSSKNGNGVDDTTVTLSGCEPSRRCTDWLPPKAPTT